MPTITEESWNLHIEQEPNFLSTPTPTEWRIQIFKITGGKAVIQTLRSGRGGGWGWSPKKIFSALRASVWYKIRGQRDPAPSCPSPGSAAAPNPLMSYFDISCTPPPKKMRTFPHIMRQGHIPPPLQKRMFLVCPITLRIFFFPANLIFSPTTFTYILFSTQRFLFNCSFSIWLWCYHYFTNS